MLGSRHNRIAAHGEAGAAFGPAVLQGSMYPIIAESGKKSFFGP